MMDLPNIDGYVDKGFAYALVVYLLWRDRDLMTALRTEMAAVRSEFSSVKENLIRLLERMTNKENTKD